MRGQQINRVSGKVLIVLSLTALLAVLSGYAQPPQLDEGTAAQIFQLSIVALVPMTPWMKSGMKRMDGGTR